MKIENPIFIILASTGAIFLIAGFVLYRWPPKKINMLYGYRTKRSMKNQETWNYAQLLGGKSLMVLGLIMISIGILALLLGFNPNYSPLYGILTITFAPFITMFIIENKIKKIFP